MSTVGSRSDEATSFGDKGPNGLASCNIFNNELSLECQCKPTSNEKSKRKSRKSRAKKANLSVQPRVHPRQDNVESTIAAAPSVSESRYEIVKKPSVPGKKKKGTPPAVDIFHEKSIPSPSSKITLKPLKQARSPTNSSTFVGTDEMSRLYDKYLQTNNQTVLEDRTEVVAAPNSPSRAKPISLFFRAKPNRKRLGNSKKECLNDNILTKGADANDTPAAASKKLAESIVKRSPLRFLKMRSEAKPFHTEEFIITNEEVSPLEKKQSSSSDPTVASVDSNTIVDTTPAPDEVSTQDHTAMDISVFEVFEQYTGGAFPHHCSPRLPRLPPKHFEFNNQAELLSQIERLQKELSESKDTVQELTQELDEVYSEKDLAIHKLDRLIESAKLRYPQDEEHEKLREIRMYLTDRTEPTISSITTGGSYHQTFHQAPESYHPFCSCLRSNE